VSPVADVVTVGPLIVPDRDQLARFHAGIYLDAFSAQREPLENWLDPQGYELDARLVLDGDEIIAGITYEAYPKSRCGLVTYMVVAPNARERGLGRKLFTYAANDLYARGARAVFGEVNRDAPERIARFVRWGAKMLDYAYVQPALGDGLDEDHGLCLMVLPPIPDHIDPAPFVAELREVLSPGYGHAHRIR
jgi:GNAT superfamily N-acetyltransferase